VSLPDSTRTWLRRDLVSDVNPQPYHQWYWGRNSRSPICEVPFSARVHQTAVGTYTLTQLDDDPHRQPARTFNVRQKHEMAHNQQPLEERDRRSFQRLVQRQRSPSDVEVLHCVLRGKVQSSWVRELSHGKDKEQQREFVRFEGILFRHGVTFVDEREYLFFEFLFDYRRVPGFSWSVPRPAAGT